MKTLAKIITFILILLQTSDARRYRNQKPNIVVILADDLVCIIFIFLLSKPYIIKLYIANNILFLIYSFKGWNDISLHGSDQIPTPNIDALGIYGVILKRHYVAPMCTPSRSALMTGKYPIHTGLQHFVIPSDCPYGLPLEEKTLPQYLKEGGYSTNLIGKWHLGMYKKNYNPIKRGFDEFFGYLGPYIDYWDHSLIMLNKNYTRGYDIRKNEIPFYDSKGIYATELFTKVAVEKIINHNKKQPLFMLLSHLAPHTANEDVPMQAPEETIKKFSYIKNPKRRIYAGIN